jgi:hypothetical protein
MLPLPLVKGVNHGNSLAISGTSVGGAKIITKQTTPESAQQDGVGSVKGIDFGRQNGGNNTVGGKRRGRRVNRTKSSEKTNNLPKKKKVLLRINGRFAKKGAK